jgi:hypothetical protein
MNVCVCVCVCEEVPTGASYRNWFSSLGFLPWNYYARDYINILTDLLTLLWMILFL